MPNEKQYYKLFDELFEKNGGADIINDGKRVLYPTHSMPSKLLEYFPNSLIINIVHEPKATTERYMDIVTQFPGYVKHYGVVPPDNEYLKFLEILNDKHPGLTIADVWAFERKKKFYSEAFSEKLEKKFTLRCFRIVFFEMQLITQECSILLLNLIIKE